MFACILRLFAFIHFCLLFSFTDHCCICSHAPPLRQPPPPSQLCSAQTGQSARTSTKWSGSVSSRSASHGTARPLFPHQLAQDMASLFPAAPPAPKEACRVSPDGKRLHLHFHFTDICIFFFCYCVFLSYKAKLLDLHHFNQPFQPTAKPEFYYIIPWCSKTALPQLPPSPAMKGEVPGSHQLFPPARLFLPR